MMDHLEGDNYKPHPVLTHALNVLFILHADHELNCSTAGHSSAIYMRDSGERERERETRGRREEEERTRDREAKTAGGENKRQQR